MVFVCPYGVQSTPVESLSRSQYSRLFAFATLTCILVTLSPREASAHAKPTHRYIAVHAFNIWPNAQPGLVASSISTEFQRHLDNQDLGTTCQGQSIGEGAEEEDDCDSIRGCTRTNCVNLFCSHFWEIDKNPGDVFSGLKCDICGSPSAYYDASVLWFGFSGDYYTNSCEKWGPVAVPSIREIYARSKADAYYVLGRVAHLLGDQGVPAHTKSDPHLLGDSYEAYMADPAHMQAYLGQGQPAAATSLTSIFYDIAQLADYFPSLYVGETCFSCTCPLNLHRGDALDERGGALDWFASFPEVGYCAGEIDPCSGSPCMDDQEDKLTADHLMPLTLRHTASLYRLFWKATHPSPLNLSGQLVGADFWLSWTPVQPSGGYPAAYRIYRSTSALIEGDFPPDSVYAEIAASQTSFQDRAISSGVRYYYAVTGIEPVSTLEPGVTRNESLLSNVVSTLNLPPSLSSGNISPSEGTLADNTTFVYGVEYRDPEGMSPAGVTLCVDGMDEDCSLGRRYIMGSIDGLHYTHLLNASQLSPGQHSYLFSAEDPSGGRARTPAAGSFPGPVVSGGELSIFVHEPDGSGDFVFRSVSPLYRIVLETIPATLSCAPNVNLYYSLTRGTPQAVTPIAADLGNISEFLWDTSVIPVGCYYVYATASDTCSDSDDSWSPGKVCISDQARPPCPEPWEPPIPLAPDGLRPDVAVHGPPPDKVYVVYRDQGIRFRRSVDSGTTWEPAQTISSSLEVDEPEAAADPAGRTHVVFEQRAGVSFEPFYARIESDGTLSGPPVQLTTSDGRPSTDPEICVGGSAVHVVWEDDRTGVLAIHYTRNASMGSGAWESERILASDVVRDLMNPSCVASGQDVMVFFEMYDAALHRRVTVVRSSDGGSSWSPPTFVDQINLRVNAPEASIAAGLAHLVFYDGRACPNVWYKRSSDAGASWTDDFQLSLACPSVESSVAAIDDRVSVAWRDQNTAAISLTSSFDRGLNWCEPEGAGFSLVIPRLTISACGTSSQLHLVGWQNGVVYSHTPLCPLPPSGTALSAAQVSASVDVTWFASDPNAGEVLLIDAFLDIDQDPSSRVPLGTDLENDGFESLNMSAIASRDQYYVCLVARDPGGLSSAYSCSPPFSYTNPLLTDDDSDGWSESAGDCDDTNPLVYPGANELCDNADNNCDGPVDGFATSCGIGACSTTGYCASGIDSCNPGQPVAEACDGVDNDCDGIVDNPPIPVGSPLLTVALSGESVLIAWSTMADASAYDVVRGDLGTLLSTGGDFSAAVESCLGNNVAETSLLATGSVAPGEGAFYVVRGLNCGGQGTYDSGGLGQVGTRDPEIIAAVLACP